MKHTGISIILAILFLTLNSCGTPPASPSFRWESGDRVTDGLLAVADHYESPGIEEWEALDSALMLVAARQREAPGAALWASARRLRLSDDDDGGRASRMDSMALEAVDSASSPYLYCRIKLDMARMLEDPAARVRACSGLLEYFAAVRDSLRITLALFDIQDAYSSVWDDSTQVECLREIKRFIPDSLSILRDIMDFNIISMLRQNPSSAEYRSMLDTMLERRRLLSEVPEVGIMVFTDLYRFTAQRYFMDSAALYVSRMGDPGHPAAMVYDIYRLRLLDSLGQSDAARMRADSMEAVLDDEGIFNMEITRELIRHYALAGDTARVGVMQRPLRADSIVVAAMGRAGHMSRIKAARDMSQLSQTLRRERDEANTGLLVLTAVVVLLTAGASGALIAYHRYHRRQRKAMETAIDEANRRLAAVCLRSASESDSARSVTMEGFEAAFTRVRPGLSEEIVRRHPGLTAYELRLCSLLSIGLDTKEIARILSIQPDSVKKSRQRLRGRLGTPSDMTFVEYFTKISP